MEHPFYLVESKMDKTKFFGSKGMFSLVLTMHPAKNGQIQRLWPLCSNWSVLAGEEIKALSNKVSLLFLKAEKCGRSNTEEGKRIMKKDASV